MSFKRLIREKMALAEDKVDRELWSQAGRRDTWLRLSLAVLVIVAAGLAIGFGLGLLTAGCDCAGG